MASILMSRVGREWRGWRGFLWVWLPSIVGVMVIAFESTETFSSANTSGWLRPVVERIFGAMADARWEVVHHSIRKSGHFLGYGLLCLAFVRSWLFTFAGDVRVGLWEWRGRASLAAIGSTALVATCDEWHQTFLPGRTGRYADVLLDSAGAVVLCVVLWVIWGVWGRRNPTSDDEAV